VSATRSDPGPTRERLLTEALTWAVGFVRCHHPRAAAEYPDMRQAAALVADKAALVTGPFQMAQIRAEVAEDELAKLTAAARQMTAAVDRRDEQDGLGAAVRDAADRLRDATPEPTADPPPRASWLSAFDLRLAMRRAAEDLTNIRPLPAWMEYPVAAVAANLTAAAGPATADVVAVEGCARRTEAELRRVRAECGRLAMLLTAAIPAGVAADGPLHLAVDSLLDLAVTPRELAGVGGRATPAPDPDPVCPQCNGVGRVVTGETCPA